MNRPRDTHRWFAHCRLHGLLLQGHLRARSEEVVGHLTALQAQEHAYARWSVVQRTTGSASAAEIDPAFDKGQILRTHVLRPTWHYVAATDLRWLIGFSGPRVDAANARRYRDLGLDTRTLSRSSDVIAQKVDTGEQTRRELAAVLEEHGISTAGERTTYMLMHAELTSVICSGPMRGKQHTYAAFDQRVPAEPGPQGDDALAELAWRYFSTRGPATFTDFSWWSGLPAGEARRGLEMVKLRLVSRDLDGRTYWFVERVIPPSRHPAIDLVQCFDEVIISYSQTRDILQTGTVTFSVPGDLDGFRHVILVDGRLLGHWRVHSHRGGPQVECRTNRHLDTKERAALDWAADQYRQFARSK